MSSTYKILCLSHDPAIDVNADTSYVSEERALKAIAEEYPDHANCDLAIGAYSYPLVRLACLGGRRPGHGFNYHVQPLWTDVGWLRLALGAHDASLPQLDAVLADLAGCWTPDRLRRLRGHLEPPVVVLA